MPSDNIKVIPSTDPSAVPVATRTLIVQGLGGVEVAYGLVGIEVAGALIPVDATHGLPVALLAGTAVIGHVIVDSIAGTVPVSASALPLPSGAATAANQATANASLASIDSHVIFCNTGAVTISAPLPAGTNAIGSVSVSNFPATQPVSGTVAISGTVAVASIGGSVEITNDVGNPIPVSGTVAVSGTVPVSGTFWQATQPVSGTFWQATQPISGTVNVGALPATPAGTNNIGSVAVPATTTGGATPFRYIAAGAANQDAATVKASAGTLYSLYLGGVRAAVAWVKFYDGASPTSADIPVLTLVVPAGTTGAGSNVPIPVQGIAFATAIRLRITTGSADNDAGAVAAGDVVVSGSFK